MKKLPLNFGSGLLCDVPQYSRFLLSAIACLLALSPTVSQAQTSWSASPATQDWFTGGNWSAGVPTASVDTIINQGSSSGSPVLINTGSAALARRLNLGSAASTSGFLRVESGSLTANSFGNTSAIGGLGTGSLVQTGGTIEIANTFSTFSIGDGVTGSGTLAVSSGTFRVAASSSFVIGNSGSGVANLSGGNFNVLASALATAVTIGNISTGNGALNLTGASALSMGTNNVLTVGASGTGVMTVAGNTVSSVGTNGTIVVRANAAGTGTIQGSGTFSYASNLGVVLLTNNGKVIADGDGISNTTLLFRSSGVSNNVQQLTANTIENTTDNGYYAQNKGQITLGSVSAGLNGLGAKVMTFGESVGDTTIDLVNSTRYTFTANSSSLLVDLSLLSDNRTGLVAAPTNVDFVGVWNLTLTGGSFTAFSAPTYNFRYDDIAAGGDAVSLYRLNGGVWDLQTFSVDAANNILSTSDTSITTLNNTFAIGYVIPEPSSLALLVGAGMLVALRRRRASRA